MKPCVSRLATIVACLLLLLTSLCVGPCISPCYGEETSAPVGSPRKDIPDTPSAPPRKELKTPVAVEHQGKDSVGGRLVFHLKELFNGSNLFSLATGDGRKIKLIVTTMEEFQERPNTTSLVSVVWTYSENEGTLKYYLAGEIGLVHSVSVKEDAERLAGRTQELSAKYGYLFE